MSEPKTTEGLSVQVRLIRISDGSVLKFEQTAPADPAQAELLFSSAVTALAVVAGGS